METVPAIRKNYVVKKVGGDLEIVPKDPGAGMSEEADFSPAQPVMRQTFHGMKAVFISILIVTTAAPAYSAIQASADWSTSMLFLLSTLAKIPYSAFTTYGCTTVFYTASLLNSSVSRLTDVVMHVTKERITDLDFEDVLELASAVQST